MFAGCIDEWTQVILTSSRSVPKLFVQFFAFEQEAVLSRLDAKKAGLVWPKTIEESIRARQTEFFYGRLAAREALARLENGPSDRSVGYGASGEPLWPEGVLGSISHVRGFACAVAVPAASNRFIGIDLAFPAQKRDCDALYRFVVNEEEIAILHSLEPKGCDVDIGNRLMNVFSAKECVYKAVFPFARRFLSFSVAHLRAYVETDIGTAPSCRIQVEVREELGGPFVKGSLWWIEVWPVASSSVNLAVLHG